MRNIFIISGPSGSGEDSIIDGLSKIISVERVITTVTRQKRIGEYDGKPYYFITKEQFEQKIAMGEFAEYAKHYNGNYYGVTTTELERVSRSKNVGIWKIDYQGVLAAKRIFPDIIAIFIHAPLTILEQRIRARDTVTEEYVTERMEYTKKWLEYQNIYDYTVHNEQGKLDEAIKNVLAIIQARLNHSS